MAIKNIHIVLGKALVIALLVLFTGCGIIENEGKSRIFLIENNSDVPVSLRIFPFLGGEAEIVILNIDERYEGTEIKQSPSQRSNPNSNAPKASFSASTIEVIYNENRKTISATSNVDNGLGFFSEPEERNLLRQGNYRKISETKYLFSITQEDYNNATPCEGSCD